MPILRRQLRVRDGPLQVLDLEVGHLHPLLRLHHLVLQLAERSLQLQVGAAAAHGLLITRHLCKQAVKTYIRDVLSAIYRSFLTYLM